MKKNLTSYALIAMIFVALLGIWAPTGEEERNEDADYYSLLDEIELYEVLAIEAEEPVWLRDATFADVTPA